MQAIGELLTFLLFAVMFFTILPWMPAWLLLSIFTPRRLLEQYFKEPHFTLTETVMMTQFPGFLMRTAIFAWLLVFPRLGQSKRKIWNIGNYMPRWYRVALRIYLFCAVFALATIIVLMPILGFLVYKLEA